MASVLHQPSTVGPDTLIAVKVLIDGNNRRFKLALRDLGAHVLPLKLRVLLAIPPEADVLFERYSDSAGDYVVLDSANPAIYKQLYRAAKAKLKLRMKVTASLPTSESTAEQKSEDKSSILQESKLSTGSARPNTYLETVLSHAPASVDSISSPKHAQPVPCAYSHAFGIPNHGSISRAALTLSRPTLPQLDDFTCGVLSIDCNHCGRSVTNEHYHCSICEEGDFDLCQTCVDAGVSCQEEDHWLIKRTIKNGKMLQSVTLTLPPKHVRKNVTIADSAPHYIEKEERTCNSCITQLPATSFVTCHDCPDFDLCLSCFETGEHGHHPAHVFQPVESDETLISSTVKQLLAAGRGLVHEAFCDGCDKQIVGVRHKCLSCPDFDYCSSCHKSSATMHPGHRFAPLYEQLLTSASHFRKENHRGVYCDGPLCVSRPNKHCIRGDRYKCAVCHDTDFCANCEAQPQLPHNKTHPLIKMRTPVRGVIVEAVNEPAYGSPAIQLGDRPAARHASTETMQPASVNVATQVQGAAEPVVTESQQAKVDHVDAKMTSCDPKTPPADLQAWFESDSTADGTTFEPGHHVSQSWTLRNPGPQAWPAGCAVHFIGGDDMRNLDMKHPSSVSSLTAANQSNVLEEPLAPGKTATFTVLLKSPLRKGRAISYWRLKTPDGQAFGHKLWVDITVAPKSAVIPEPTTVSPAPVPAAFGLVAGDKALDGSTMIFPKLDKESPESSTHNINQTSGDEHDLVGHTDEEDLVDDLESLELEDDEAGDGFLTDEEYDILDADDEEFLEEAQRAVADQK